ncbi:MAG: hypothetical protein BWY72_02396 [Bacteroidetes bacterium ADurb.Bin416]|nr:MAG: hypothetical protein BWY72_02396 [Bacteroidetes bacterium ADurb.Bin416]
MLYTAARLFDGSDLHSSTVNESGKDETNGPDLRMVSIPSMISST